MTSWYLGKANNPRRLVRAGKNVASTSEYDSRALTALPAFPSIRIAD
jgi:hypothetical protein